MILKSMVNYEYFQARQSDKIIFMKFGIKTFILKTNKLNRALTLQNNKKKLFKINIQRVEGEIVSMSA